LLDRAQRTAGRNLLSGVPSRNGFLVGYARHQQRDEAIKVGGSLPVDPLIRVVLGATIAGAVPLPVDALALASGSIAEGKGGRRDACLQKRPLVGAPQEVAFGLGITLRGNAKAGSHRPHIVAQRRVGAFSVVDDIAAGRLVPLLEDFNPGDVEVIHAVFAGGLNTPARVRVFVEYLAAHLT
jgi:hypothetical protein